MRPVTIPETAPERYISFNRALNLRLPGEVTGDWHFKLAFFESAGEPPKTVSLVGKGEKVNTVPTLGILGVRDMGQVLLKAGVLPAYRPVHVANHYRAISDLVVLDFEGDEGLRTDLGDRAMVAGVRTINQWLDTEEQISELLERYLMPLSGHFSGLRQRVYDKWLRTVTFS